MIHLLPVPEDARLGPRLLPMYYAPLFAVLLGRRQSALIVALVAPWLNWALTAHPAPPGALVMTIQLAVFVYVLGALLAGLGARWFLAAPAYFAGLAAAMLTVALYPGLIGSRTAWGWAVQSAATGLPGIAILVLVNWLVIRSYPTGLGGGPRAA